MNILSLRIILLFAVVLILSACDSTPCSSPICKQPSITQNGIGLMLQDDIFVNADSYDIETPESLFVLSDEAQEFVKQAVSGYASDEKKVAGLMSAIFDRSEFDLLYRSDANTDATTTFENRAANCLSLTIMTYAMASKAGFNARFQQIAIPEFWTRRSGYSLLNHHVNLKILPRYSVSTFTMFSRDLIIDFDPQEGLNDFEATELDKTRIVSMYYNNKAAELILNNELEHAYAYLKAALILDPAYEGALLNLGIVYRQTGQLKLAEQLYRVALTQSPNYLIAHENLAHIYELSGRISESEAIRTFLARKREENPYYHMMLAEEAIEHREFAHGIQYFKRAIALNDKPHQFYFGLAKAYLELNDLNATERYLRLAKRKAGKSRIAQIYGNKMSMLASIQSR